MKKVSKATKSPTKSRRKPKREKLPLRYASDLNLRCRWHVEGVPCGQSAVAFVSGMDLCEQHRRPGAIKYASKPKGMSQSLA